MKRYFSLLVSLLLILSLFTGCGSSSYENDMSAGMPMEEMGAMDAPEEVLSNTAAPEKTKLPENRKWVITSEIRAETNHLDGAVDSVLAKAGELGGYVEDQHFDNGSYYGGYDAARSAHMTIRIPAEKVDAFVETVEEKTNVVSSSRNLQDITLQYTDTETRITALKTEEARLLKRLMLPMRTLKNWGNSSRLQSRMKLPTPFFTVPSGRILLPMIRGSWSILNIMPS